MTTTTSLAHDRQAPAVGAGTERAGTTLLEWNRSLLPGRYAAAVSLHSHTSCSREAMTLMPSYLERIPLVAGLVRRELDGYRRRHGRPVDFATGWWQPPVDPEAVLASETGQIERLGLRPLVSITDHDRIEAALELRRRRRLEDVVVSFEWTVPFHQGFFHLGVHNLRPTRAVDLYRQLAACTQSPARATVAEALDALHADPETLVILNHPLWDLADVGTAAHASLLRTFLDDYGTRIHGLEANGYRTWQENAAVIPLAAAAALPVVSGGDRHGCSPNSLLNLTAATSFGAFVREIREERRSTVLILPDYRRSIVARKLAVAVDAMRPWAGHGDGRRYWTDRVCYERDGAVRRLSAHWPDGGPLWVRSAMTAFRLAASPPVQPLLRMAVWLAGASRSHAAIPKVAARAPVAALRAHASPAESGE